MKFIGLDYGSKTVGVAVSDSTGLIASAYETIVRENETKLRKTLARIEEILKEQKAEVIVLGYPKNMDQSIGDRAKKTAQFASMLERRTGFPVVLWDERLTTVAAEEILIESGVRREDRKKYIDKIAAAIILQDYLDAKRDQENRERMQSHPMETEA